MNLDFAAITYRAVRDRIRAEDPQIDEQTLADTVEGLTDVHEILPLSSARRLLTKPWQPASSAASTICRDGSTGCRTVLRSRRIARDVIVELDIKKITAPDFTVSIRPGMPSLLVLDEAAVPSTYWQPSAPRLNRQGLLSELKEGADVEGVALSNPESRAYARWSGQRSCRGPPRRERRQFPAPAMVRAASPPTACRLTRRERANVQHQACSIAPKPRT